MKILHTGDWHIGKLVHNVHMTEDQRHVLKSLIELIKSEKPDVMIIAGDIYDRSVPPPEAVDLLDQTLTEIVMTLDTPVIAIAGNHDSPDRVGFASRMLEEKGLYLRGHIDKAGDPITLEDAFGKVDFWPLPYAEPVLVRELFQNPEIKSHNDAMAAILDRINEVKDRDRRHVCIAHAYLMGTEGDVSDSVRPLSIGGSEYVDPAMFLDFNYVALGHLHRPQKVKEAHIRYAGSLMKYSFSEANQSKSVAMVNLDGQGSLQVTYHTLSPIRDMRVIKGPLQELVDAGNRAVSGKDDYIMATLTDQGELIEPLQTLRRVYPNILRVEKEPVGREAGEEQTSAGEDFRQKNPLELFGEFYENMAGSAFDQESMKVVARVIDQLMEKGRKS